MKRWRGREAGGRGKAGGWGGVGVGGCGRREAGGVEEWGGVMWFEGVNTFLCTRAHCVIMTSLTRVHFPTRLWHSRRVEGRGGKGKGWWRWGVGGGADIDSLPTCGVWFTCAIYYRRQQLCHQQQQQPSCPSRHHPHHHHRHVFIRSMDLSLFTYFLLFIYCKFRRSPVAMHQWTDRSKGRHSTVHQREVPTI